MRVLLASDGLWDVIKYADAAQIAATSSTPKVCASRLIRVPEVRKRT